MRRALMHMQITRSSIDTLKVPVEELFPGDHVFFSENHWHGATPTPFMVYIAMQQNDESGSPVSWGEHVTDTQYRGVGIDR